MSNRMYEQFTSIFCYICNIQLLIGEYSFESRNITNFYKLFGNYKKFQRKLPQLESHLYPQNTKFKGEQLRMQCQDITIIRLSYKSQSYQFSQQKFHKFVYVYDRKKDMFPYQILGHLDLLSKLLSWQQVQVPDPTQAIQKIQDPIFIKIEV